VGEAEAANKGGVRGEDAVGRLLAMAWETGDGPVRCGGVRRTAVLGRLDRGREMRVGPARQRGRRWEERVGRLAGGPALGRGEVGRGWVENRRWAKVQKEIPFEFQLILGFGRTLKNCTWRFRKKFDMGIFLKSSRLSKYFRKIKYVMP
jgi:hypothetical protein